MLKDTKTEKIDSAPLEMRSVALVKVAEFLHNVPPEAHVTVLLTVWEETNAST